MRCRCGRLGSYDPRPPGGRAPARRAGRGWSGLVVHVAHCASLLSVHCSVVRLWAGRAAALTLVAWRASTDVGLATGASSRTSPHRSTSPVGPENLPVGAGRSFAWLHAFRQLGTLRTLHRHPPRPAQARLRHLQVPAPRAVIEERSQGAPAGGAAGIAQRCEPDRQALGEGDDAAGGWDLDQLQTLDAVLVKKAIWTSVRLPYSVGTHVRLTRDRGHDTRRVQDHLP